MIRYALVCAGEHCFESWFRDSAAFDTLAEAGAVSCPVCGSPKVSKALMAPSVVTSRGKAARPPAGSSDIPAASAPSLPEPTAPTVLINDHERQLRARLRALHREIVAKSDDVGRAFATEARRMHEGDAPQRSIHGEATRTEVESLLEDGVPLLPMPPAPDDHN